MAHELIHRVDRPDGLHRDVSAVREGLPPTVWREDSEALFLASSFVQPDAAEAPRGLRTRTKPSLNSASRTRRSYAWSGAWPRSKGPRPAWPRRKP